LRWPTLSAFKIISFFNPRVVYNPGLELANALGVVGLANASGVVGLANALGVVG
jgi:hypothetical protein